ncbi:MAG TPA: hypothetical protein P5079_11785, partial [Elusimicrobiota bacterium]|nr:hypothetical protein [Elusimicrobiota bacterium]
MKIVFTIAPYAWSELYPGAQSKQCGFRMSKKFGLIPGSTAPLGILYLSRMLKNAGHDVEFIDGV